MHARIFGSILRLRQLAQKFNHFWSYAIPLETIADLFWEAKDFADFQNKIKDACVQLDESPIGGRYFGDAIYDNGWLKYTFGRHGQLKVALNPDMIFQAEYVGSEGVCTRATYDDAKGELKWEIFPQRSRDAVRVLRALSVLAEADTKMFTDTHLPEDLKTPEAYLYINAPSWGHLMVNPDDLKDILSA